METQQSSDPFVRNRHWWALALWVVMVVPSARGLDDGGWGVTAFLLSAVIWSVIAYMLGSHKDRDQPSFWRPLVPVWVILLVLMLGWLAFVSLSDGSFKWGGLWPLAWTALLLALVVDAYRRTAAGQPWQRTRG